MTIKLDDETTIMNEVLASDDPLATWNVMTRFLPEDLQEMWDREFLSAVEDEQHEIWRGMYG